MKKNILGTLSNLFQGWLLVAAFVVAAVACSPQDEDESPYLNVLPSSIVFSEKSTDANIISIESSGEWVVEAGSPAPKVDKQTGSGNATIHVTDAPVGKSTFMVSMGALKCEVSVTRFESGNPDPDPDPDPLKPQFGKASATDVTKTSAILNCNYKYDVETTNVEVGFAYKTTSDKEYLTQITTATSGDKTITISNLKPATAYTFHLYAKVGTEIFKSAEASFITQDETTPPPPGTALFGKSWAELPNRVELPSDYYYAYHMRADASSIRNYTVCYSKELGCPVWVAAPMHTCYKGSSGRNDAYKQDPTLSNQGCSQRGPWDGYTRGHLLGSSERTVSVATNKQVFYYSNIGPQMQNGFNTGGGAWNNLESLVDGEWCADTLYQVIGCHWANKNKKVDGTVIPTHYYKVLLRTKSGNTRKSVANCTATELKCAAFMLEHKPQKGLKPNASMMISVSELEKLTGFTYFPNVPNAPKSECKASDWGL